MGSCASRERVGLKHVRDVGEACNVIQNEMKRKRLELTETVRKMIGVF